LALVLLVALIILLKQIENYLIPLMTY
jgi:hypothetical protein